MRVNKPFPNRIWLLLIAASFLMQLMIGCASVEITPKVSKDTPKTSSHYPVTIRNYHSDRSKADITFTKKPTRVVAVQQNTIETLLALGLDDVIIAASCTSNHSTDFMDKYRDRAKKLPTVQRQDLALETVLMLEPDLIMGWQSTFSNRGLRSTRYWHERGVNTYIVENSNSILPIGRVEDEYTFISNVGKIFDVEDKAQAMIKEIEDEIKTTLEKTKGRPPQRVLIVELMGRSIVTYDKRRLGGDMIKKLGGQLINASSRIGQEDLIMHNPDVIFVVCTGWKEDSEMLVNKILRNPAYECINAVKNQRVYAIPLMYMYASATRTLEGIRTFKQGLYPDL